MRIRSAAVRVMPPWLWVVRRNGDGVRESVQMGSAAAERRRSDGKRGKGEGGPNDSNC